MSKLENKRIAKYATKPLAEFSCPKSVVTMVLFPSTSFWSVHFTMTTVRKFFLLQWKQKHHLTHYPIINVESDLDYKIPFTPSKIYVYMDFSAFFCRPLGMLYHRLGMAKSTKFSNNFFKFLTHMYNCAYDIYTFSMTTTNRPDYEEMPQFVTIHKNDPHYLCVPSLHVTIACGTYIFHKHYLSTVLPEEEAAPRIEEIRQEAAAIVESVLFVKQHSVNCVPAALYMLTATMPEDFFPKETALEFIDMLFQNPDDLSPEIAEETRNHFKTVYNQFYEENKKCGKWQEPVKNWLINHAKKTNQKL